MTFHFKSPAPVQAAAPDTAASTPIRVDFWAGHDLKGEGARMAMRGRTHDLPGFAPFRLRARMDDNQSTILANYLAIHAAARDGATITPAAEWLMDNHHIVDETFRHVRRDLTPAFYRTLPQMEPGGIPRALALVWRYVAIADSELRMAELTAMVEGYQSLAPLRIGEIWAVPALMRFVLLENLRRLSDRVERSRAERAEANALADAAAQPGWTAEGLGDAPLGTSLAAQLIYRFRDGGTYPAAATGWLAARLAAQSTDPDHVVAAEHATQSSGNVTTGSIIRSLRLLDDVDWLAWFEQVSVVDRELRTTPHYRRLDKATRNAYRDTIERIGRRGDGEEIEVARAALRIAGADGDDLGHILLGSRRVELEAVCAYRYRAREHLAAAYRRAGWLGVALPMLGLTVVALWALAQVLPPMAAGLWWLLVALAVLPGTEAAMALLGFAAARLLQPRTLPAYDYSGAIPEEARTLVVIPCLLSSHDTIDDLLSNLEMHYLANPRGAVYFALLSDWSDAPAETAPDDAALLNRARDGIDALAAKYAHDGGRRFYLLHRRRLWNAGEGVWMGWERKRGKLQELNQLLLGEPHTTFVDTGPRPPQGVRYVMTLDADTRLPRDAVAALVGKMDHPMNRPQTDPKTGLVVRGHAILQPRVTPSLTSGAESSIFQQVFSVNRGMDPYVFAVSDLYQDLLGQGSFTGKGLYAVAAFERAMAGRIPENTVLSHDLLEGSLARAALVTDVQVIEDFPTRYEVDAARQHRWARGDWQLLPFIFGRSGLDGLARFKMADNLRRSLVPMAWIAASVAGWLALPAGAAALWQAGLVLAMALAPALGFVTGLMPRQRGAGRMRHLRVVLTEARGALAEIALRLTFLAHLAGRLADAIGRSLYRMTVSRRHLLEWRPAQAVHGAARGDLRGYWRAMWLSPALGGAVLALVGAVNPQNLPLALLFAWAWIAAPFAAWGVSRGLETEDRLVVRPADRVMLRQTARITWRYFETFVTADTHHLPPDNFQEDPDPRLARRTSPTNIGLYLLSIVTARDFGWIGFAQAIARIEATLATTERLEKHRGHLFNWYDTSDLRVLEPRYVSAVDSGNLAGHLVTLAVTLKGWARNPSVHLLGNLAGLGDVLGVLRARLAAVPDDRRALRPLRRRLEERIDGFGRSLDSYLREPHLAPVRALSLGVIAGDIIRLARDFAAEADYPGLDEVVWWAGALRDSCEALTRDALPDQHDKGALARRLEALAERARGLAFAMDFAFLMDPDKRLLSIGFNAATGERDASCYDLLASEARLASFLAIAKGDLPVEHWQRLGRPVTAFGSQGALLSWSGSMFEFLMPPLVMQERVGSLLNTSNAMAVQAQMAEGRRLGLPWGVSESAFAARDPEMNYQYHAFGVAELGLKRSLARDRVVAPYASILAAQINPAAAVTNLRRLERLGATGIYGFYDAVDFTPARLEPGRSHAIVRNYMAHHHGMSLLATANALMDGIHRTRFHEDPVIKAAELLLQERAPREIVPVTRTDAVDPPRLVEDGSSLPQDEQIDPATGPRSVAVLSNGRTAAMLTSTGAGSLMRDGIAVTRWRADPTVDQGGLHVFLRDTASGDWWSATASPRRAEGEVATACLSDHMAEFVKTARDIECRMQVIVASEAEAEGRRLCLRNLSAHPRVIEVTTYAEIVLDRAEADRAHPAFSRMFVQTEIRDGHIRARRKPRGAGPDGLRLAHLTSGPEAATATTAETDRRAFIGRGRTLAQAAAFDRGAVLGGGQGYTLDPCMALRRAVRLPPGKAVELVIWTITADTDDALSRAVAHYSRAETFDHEARLAWTHSQVQLRHLGISPDEAALFRRYAALMIQPDLSMALADPDTQAAMGPQSALWPLGLSGDRPVMVVRIDNQADLPALRQVFRMQDYFRARGVAADLVVLNDRASTYIQELHDGVAHLAQAALAGVARPDVFVVRRDQTGAETLATLLAVARVVIHLQNGNLGDQMRRQTREPPPLAPPPAPLPRPAALDDPGGLRFWNGYGGFDAGARDYVLHLSPGQPTPHPWINVIARPDFGFHVSASGAGYVWAANSRDYQITPWSNDPVSDPPGEALLVQETATGRVISPFQALTTDPAARHEVRHGMGYSRFTTRTPWAEVEALMCLAADGPARLTRLTIRNLTGQVLRLRAHAYADLVLGQDRSRTAPMIRVGHDPARRALLARNPFATEYGGRVTALAMDTPLAGHTARRGDWLGRGGSLANPVALAHWPGDGTDTDGDACLALCADLTVAPGTSRDLTLVLADAPDGDIAAVLDRALAPGAVDRAMAAARAEWDHTLGAVQVDTPDEKLNLLVNAWLPYQALACRIRARSAFYQASGAYGFRDQLQDTAALILQDPSLARLQILRAAGRQFPEGDVQHWWLPATGAGVRTMISDDVVWLAHCIARYVDLTGDTAILDETVPWLTGSALEEGQHDAFFTPGRDGEASLYDHAVRALDLAIQRAGPNGLPLILGGDWNDGMNRVGEGGRGESIWLGWFLGATLGDVAPLARARGDGARADRWMAHRMVLASAIDRSGWDGAWYRRATYDDGTPLGSQQSDECRIDSIAQSWAVLSGLAPADRAARAIDAALDQLFDPGAGLIRLFTPPFEHTDRNPGYIKGYPPGVRENGGQYTHAAAWMVQALARMGRGDEAWRLFDRINPISHSDSRDGADLYRVEPYVIAADIYAEGDRRGRGGWSWYTGSAGWMLRVAVEDILGLRLKGGKLTVSPSLPADWPGFTARLRLPDGTRHRVTVTRDGTAPRVEITTEGSAATP